MKNLFISIIFAFLFCSCLSTTIIKSSVVDKYKKNGKCIVLLEDREVEVGKNLYGSIKTDLEYYIKFYPNEDVFYFSVIGYKNY